MFSRGSQPILVRNDFRNNAGATISLNANALTAGELRDTGRQTGLIDRYLKYDGNVGPLIADNTLTYDHLALANSTDPKVATAGLVVRGQQITVESVWDDTDITHILIDSDPNGNNSEITVENFHTATGLQLRSRPDESLVVKLQGANAGFTATGRGFDIDDRIGGTVQIIGQPGFPVVMTSLFDSDVGAGVDALGQSVLETVNATTSNAASGDWRGLNFLPLSNDRNVSVFVEPELLNISGVANSINSTVEDATNIGVLAPNFATSTQTVVNSSESAQEKSGDDNRRLGFEVHGSIAYDTPGDIDVYAFDGYPGSEVWIDVDKTSSSLDLMLELLDASGDVVLARSIDSQLDQVNYAPILEQAQGLEREAFRGKDFYTTNPRDPGFRVILPGVSGDLRTRYFIRLRSQPAALGSADFVAQQAALSAGTASGKTSGLYQLRVRLRQQDEKPGSTVRYADIRYPTIGIDAKGLPSHSPLTGENGEIPGSNNDSLANAQELGNLLATDRGTISVAGEINNESDIDWYRFELGYLPEQEEPWAWSTIFDIDYADGMRGDLTLSVFDANGALIFVGRDSDVVDDQRGIDQENDFDDLSRGSLGKLDPFIGSAFLPAGNEFDGTSETYFVAVSSNDFISDSLDQFYEINATTPLARLEPVTSVGRIVEDHIGSTGYDSGGNGVPSRGIINTENALALSAHVREFTLADMTGFLTTTSSLRTFNPSTGQLDAIPTNGVYNYSQGGVPGGSAAGDLDMLTNGTLVVYINEGGNTDANNVGTVFNVDPGLDGDLLEARHGDGIDEETNATGTPPVRPADNVWEIDDSTVDAVVIGRSGFDEGSNTVLYNPSGNDNTGGSAGSAIFYSVRDNEEVGAGGSRSVIYGANSTGDAGSIISTGSNTHDYGRFGWVPGGNTGPEAVGNPGVNVPAGFEIDGFTTGLQFRNEVRNANQLYAVSQGGQFFRISPRDADLSRPNDSNTMGAVNGVHDDEVEISDARDLGEFLTGVQGNNNGNFVNRTLEGLAPGPVNLEGGRYQGMFFAVTNFGELICIDPDGGGADEATIVDNVFDTDGDGIADSWISNSNVGGGVTGFAFSQLDVNLWHPTNLREADDGHGVRQAPDNTRRVVPSPASNHSMMFGLEEHDLPATARYNTFAGSGGQQFGVIQQTIPGVNSYTWQADLASGALENSELDANYNIAGGAHGSLITDPFSLAGYAGTDKPTLYFNYFLDTQEANSDTSNGGSMRDSARAFASRDGGVTWELLATNNSIRSGLEGSNPNAELPPAYSVSSQLGAPVDANGERNQRVQELFDSSGTWRQARVDLNDFAGESSVTLRFDFSTGGDLDRNAVNNAKIVPDAIRLALADAVAADPLVFGDDTFLVEMDSAGGLEVGMHAMRREQQNIDAGVDPTDPAFVPPESIAEVLAITTDPLTLAATVLLQSTPGTAVTWLATEEIEFFSAGTDKDNIPSIASTIGTFANPQARSTSNDHEGFYVDDIIVGFAERGEMVVDTSQNNQLNNVTGFDDLATPQATGDDYQGHALQGEYQLEIRRGTEYGTRDQGQFITINSPFDTNDRHVLNPAEAPVVIAENDLQILDGIEVFGVVLGDFPGNHTTHSALFWARDLSAAVVDGNVNAFLEFSYETQGGKLENLPATWNLNNTNLNPPGDGVAVSFDAGVNWTRISNVTHTGGEVQTLEVHLGAFGVPNANTVIGFFNSGANLGEILFSDAVVRTAPVISTTGLVGDRNIIRQQGQFVIENNIISHAQEYGNTD